MSLKNILGLAIAAGLALSTPALAEKLEKVTLASPFAPLVMPMAYIVENGLLDEVAEETELEIWNTPDQLRAMMASGSVQFASVPSNVAAIFYNKGVPLKMVHVSIWGVMYVVSAEGEAGSLSDLRGQTVHVPFRGDQPDLIFQTIARSQGLEPLKDFDVQYVSSPLDIVAGLMAGTIKNALLIEPVSSMVIMKGAQKGLTFKRVVDIQTELGKIEGWEDRFPNAGVVALPGILDNPEAVEAFAKAYDEAVDWAVANPAEAAALAAKHVPGVNAAAFEESLKHTIFDAVPSGEARPAMETMFGAFIGLNPKSVGGQLPDDGFYYP